MGSRFTNLEACVRAAVDELSRRGVDPFDPHRGLYVTDAEARDLAARPAPGGIGERLEELRRRLALDELETEVLGLVAAPELDERLGRVYGFLHDDLARRLATPRLVARLLAHGGHGEGEVLAAFSTAGRLVGRGIVRLDEPDRTTPFVELAVRADPSLVAYLLGFPHAPAPAGHSVGRVDPPGLDLGRTDVLATLRAHLDDGTTTPVTVVGGDATWLLAVALQRPLLVAGLSAIALPPVARHLELVALLEGRQLVFEHDELAPGDRPAVLQALRTFTPRPLVICRTMHAAAALTDAAGILVPVREPSFAERQAVWTAYLPGADVDDVAAKFALTAGQIAYAAGVARAVAAARGRAPSRPDLDHGARQASRTGLSDLARPIAPSHTWDDLVLPARQRDLLSSIAAYLRHRNVVLEEWGFDRRIARAQGLKALFAGESGTGKTMAAQVIANDLGLDLFQVDLATVVSKYIGETEKNLDRIFNAAAGSNAILFFDEADAMFGRRSEVSDAKDRYANIEVAYLLQRMESYPGAVVLASNYRANIDAAFLRRLDFVIDFPFPEAEDRHRIWHAVMPGEAPLDGSVDFEFLAERFKLAGGGIRNCCLAAAFMAAEEGTAIGMRHLVRAVAVEYGKLGRLTLEADFQQYFGDLARV